jgi:hypothetical protein
MSLFAKAFSLSAVIVYLGGTAGWSQVKLTTPECSIAFGSGWAMFDSAELAIAKDDGVSGIALIRSSRDDGSTPLNLTQEAKAAGDSLDANLTLTKDETRTIGAYSVRIFTLNYDTLARVERVAKAHGRNNTFRNGSLKVYVIRSGGVRINIIGVYAVALFTPYASIEQAIPSLAMTPVSALPRASARPAGVRWSVDSGTLRFTGEAPREVSARDGRGRLVRLMEGTASAGAEWNLPSGPGPLFLVARFSDRRLAPLGWWSGRP